MTELTGKIALVTGAGRGIGRATAELLADQGATVAVTARTETQVRDVAAGIRGRGGQALCLAGDITDEAFADRLFAHIAETCGRLDILVNNAGIAPFGPVEDVPAQALRDVLEVNVVAVYICMQRAIRMMKESGGIGTIVNVGSVRSHWTENGDCGAYNASKYAVRGLTESVARQLHGTGLNIRVGLICPGVTDTPLTNPKGEPRPEFMRPGTVARAILHAVTAPEGVNVFDTTLFSTAQKPW